MRYRESVIGSILIFNNSERHILNLILNMYILFCPEKTVGKIVVSNSIFSTFYFLLFVFWIGIKIILTVAVNTDG